MFMEGIWKKGGQGGMMGSINRRLGFSWGFFGGVEKKRGTGFEWFRH